MKTAAPRKRSTLVAMLGTVLLLTVAMAPASAQVATERAAVGQSPADPVVEQALIALSQQLLDAQRGFDQAALDALLAPDYVEISPVGEVDRREEVLGFYSAEAKAKSLPAGATAPALTLSEPLVRVAGDHARVIARETMTLPGRTVALRVALQFRRIDGQWRVQGAQYTPIREPAKPH